MPRGKRRKKRKRSKLDSRVNYELCRDGAFVVEGYNWAPAQSNFLPGIAGPWGVPLWAYYVNRGQGMASVGLGDKDGQILPFESFNLACDSVTRRGFRTFLRVKKKELHEPFRKTEDTRVTQRMVQTAGELHLEEQNVVLGLDTRVTYYTVPNYPYGLFVRVMKLKNTTNEDLYCEVLDGLARVIPHGVGYERSVFIARHIEAMMGVRRTEGAALFRLNQTAADSEQVAAISGGNFYIPLLNGKKAKEELLVDPEAVFGDPVTYERPWTFERAGLKRVRKHPQKTACKTPCAFYPYDGFLRADQELVFTSVFGHVEDDAGLERILGDVTRAGFLETKRREGRRILEEIQHASYTVSASPELDAYCGRNFLDNVLRGGMPRPVETAEGKRAYYLYSRQNGDLERDYHWFVLQPSYLSQGTGHYRSILQNRRSDTWFFPEVEDDNLALFMNLIQLDGYNPLEVGSLVFRFLEPKEAPSWVDGALSRALFGEDDLEALRKALEGVHLPEVMRERELLIDSLVSGFFPGEVIRRLEALATRLNKELEQRTSRAERERKPKGKGKRGQQDTATDTQGAMDRREALLDDLLRRSVLGEVGSVHEGFWVDHWTYNLDLLESYLAVYPDRLYDVLLGRGDYTFFDNPDVVCPRREKTVLRDDGTVRRYGAVRRDPEKERLIDSRRVAPNTARISKGKGKGRPYATNLLVKLLVVVVNRMATLDPFGRGVEMEADKPGWNDSLNGLPGLFGSSSNECLELLRAVRLLRDYIDCLSRTPQESARPHGRRANHEQLSVKVFAELHEFMKGLEPLLQKRLKGRTSKSALNYWEASNTLKEEYRDKTRLGVRGREVDLDSEALSRFLELCQRNLERIFSLRDSGGPGGMLSPEGVPYTYFINEVTNWEETGETSPSGLPLVKAKAWSQRPVRLFLEGPVHYMKVFPERAREVYRSVRESNLFDDKLEMYKSCENMEGEDPEIGRAVGAYPRGWIENESIYLHMEYKYLLEILRSGLCEEYYGDIASALVAFQKPESYGRNPLEGASFLVSSAFEDPTLHGRAYQPRLSGITCEFVHMWTLMMAGPAPMRVTSEGDLYLQLSPRLSGAYFLKAHRVVKYLDPLDGLTRVRLRRGDFAFNLFGRCLVVYRNPEMKDTFGDSGVGPVAYQITYHDGRVEKVEGAKIQGQLARDVRAGKVKRLEVTLRS